jgi:4-amino-4-deoxy-L-arabinose transferase-like glycosyltransferase
VSTVAFLVGPALVLVGAWALVTAWDERRPRRLRLALGALLLAVVVTALGAAADSPSPAPSSGGRSSTGA